MLGAAKSDGRAPAPRYALSQLSYEQDYLMRLVKKVGEVLARALGLGKAGNFDESLRVLEQGIGAELGMPFAMLLRLEPKSAVSLLGKEKASAFAQSLRTRALLFELGDQHEEAGACAARADELERLLADTPAP